MRLVVDHGGKGKRRAPSTRRRTHPRAVGLGTAVGAFLAFGIIPVSNPPGAQADDLGLGDIIGDLLGNTGATGDTDALSALDTSSESIFQQVFYDPIHTSIEGWINSSIGEQVDGTINQMSGQYLIGDGTAGTIDNPNGGAGGLLFGDGGNGYDESANAGVIGGNGGAASWFGNGGDGGAGGAGANGGDGGAGGTAFGNGGDGGAAGNGDTPDGLPALGGAGGTGGMLVGNHGAVGAFGTLTSGVPNPDPNSLSSTDSWITNSDGQVVVMHGFNEVIKMAPYTPTSVGFSDDDAQLLEDNGFNAVRLGLDWAAVEPEPGVFDDAYLASIDQTIQMLQSHGIYVILDMHQDGYSSIFGGEGAPAWATLTGGLSNPTDMPFQLAYFANAAENHAWDALWSNTAASNGVGLENAYAQMWEHVANHFNGNSDIAGYEIMNEPWAGSLWPQSMFGNPAAFGTGVLAPFYNQVDAAIRAVDPSTPVYFESTILASEGLPIGLGPVHDPNTVFALHDYCPPGFPDSVCGLFVNMSANNAVTYADSQGIPVVMTEFGSTYNGLNDELKAAAQHMFGWTEWTYSNPGVTSGGSDAALVTDPSQSLSGDNLNSARLATLAEPYPQLVSGTPSSWSFENGVFTFSYSTAMADSSGDFAAGSETTISTPAGEFPNGYTVTVTGGTVVSAPNAAELVIASHSGASTISVTVNPVS